MTLLVPALSQLASELPMFLHETPVFYATRPRLVRSAVMPHVLHLCGDDLKWLSGSQNDNSVLIVFFQLLIQDA